MTRETVATAQAVIRLERRYEVKVEDLWRLWTTKAGLESWWGPEGFVVKVHQLELRVGGKLSYDMIADAPPQIEFMKQAGMPRSHATHATFVAIEPLERLVINHLIDFIPGVKPYDNRVQVEFFRDGREVRMLITVDAHPDPQWTQRATLGWESQLTKLPAALRARA